jgi:chromosome segregation ATPase
MRKKCAGSALEVEKLKTQAKEIDNNEKELHEQIAMVEKELVVHRRETKLRDTAVEDRERRIYELIKTNLELEKFKFVLDFKIKELREQIEPRQQQIVDLRDRIAVRDRELEEHHAVNCQLDNSIGQLRHTILSLQEHLTKTRQKRGKQETNLLRFRSDLQSAANSTLNPSLLRYAVTKLTSMHGTASNIL